MFFTTKDKEETLSESHDQFNDSYVRDTTVEELREVSTSYAVMSQCANPAQLLEKMGKNRKGKTKSNPEAIEKLTGRIQEKVDAGWTLPPGWLYKGLTFYIPDSKDGSTSERSESEPEPYRTQLARNTARFAGATIASSLKDSSITHVVVGPETRSSDISSLRTKLSKRKKLPHIVKVEWVEESWKERTLLDEERKFLYT